jgi:catechol 2,3-dioxygenase-like lactoylglutathione lyase family enzyme
MIDAQQRVETMTTTQNLTNITDVGGVAVPVSDQDDALRFYVERLGFEVVRDVAMGDGGRWVQVVPRGGRVSMALVAAGDGGATGIDTGITLATTDADADHVALAATGVDVDELLTWPGVPAMFVFRDFDRNQLKVMQSPTGGGATATASER